MRRLTPAQLIVAWHGALDAAAAATTAAFDVKALDAAGRIVAERRIRAEREWLSRFERESMHSVP